MSSTESTEPKTNNPETPAGGVVDQHGHVKIQILLRSSEPNCSCFQPPFISWSTNSEFAVLQCPNSINCPNIFSRHWFWHGFDNRNCRNSSSPKLWLDFPPKLNQVSRYIPGIFSEATLNPKPSCKIRMKQPTYQFNFRPQLHFKKYRTQLPDLKSVWLLQLTSLFWGQDKFVDWKHASLACFAWGPKPTARQNCIATVPPFFCGLKHGRNVPRVSSGEKGISASNHSVELPSRTNFLSTSTEFPFPNKLPTWL